MMLGLLTGALLGILFFSYKPLFRVLKANSFSPLKAFKAIQEQESTQREFQEFSKEQMALLSRLLTSKKDTKNPEQQEKTQSNTEESTFHSDAENKEAKREQQDKQIAQETNKDN